MPVSWLQVKADDGWLIIPGVLRDGTSVDVLPVLKARTGSSWLRPLNPQRPGYRNQRYLPDALPSIHWQHYIVNLARKDTCVHHCGAFANHLCKVWNTELAAAYPGKALLGFKLIWYSRWIEKRHCPAGLLAAAGLANGTTVPCTVGVDKGECLLWSHRCFSELQMPDRTVKPPTLRDVHRTVRPPAVLYLPGRDVEL